MVLDLPETTVSENGQQPGKYLHWAVPEGLNVAQDSLVLRLDFYTQSVVMQRFRAGVTEVKHVSTLDVAEALANQMDFSTGLLPPETLWMTNTKAGRLYALWCPPAVRTLALMRRVEEPPERYTIPVPGLIFLCLSGRPPWVYACSKRPLNTRQAVFNAPFFNVFESGRVCEGSHQFPEDVTKIPESFFVSFFSREGDPAQRTKAHSSDLRKRWQTLEGKKRYPLRDLVRFGAVADLLRLEVRR